MKENKINLKNQGNIVNPIVFLHLVKKWDLAKKHPVVHTKIVITKMS
jgi:hypothetical protein